MVNKGQNGNNGNNVRFGESKGQAGLLSYLAQLGLGDTDLAQVMSMLHPSAAQDPVRATQALGQSLEAAPPQRRDVIAAKQTIRLYLAEEQQILREAYQSFFNAQATVVSGRPTIEMLGSSDDVSSEFLVEIATALKPNVMLLGVNSVHPETIDKLERLRDACADVGLVLLFASFDVNGIKALREFSKDASVGCAYLLKHTIDTVEQLTQVIYAVAEGRIIIDPMVMEGLIRTGDEQSSFLRELSPRELEVLSWISKGYRNDTIAGVLSRDVKTVERHINNIYSKLHSEKTEEDTSDSMHPRVRAALTYLRGTGLLPSEHFAEE